MRFILDAGPALNFLAVGQQNCLIQLASAVSAELCVPEQVAAEIAAVAAESRFERSGAARRWATLSASQYLSVLDDDVSGNPALASELSLVAGAPAATRVRDRRDLGEHMVIVHGMVLARQGHAVYLLIDDGDGRRRAQEAKARLRRLDGSGQLNILSTRGVLENAKPAWFTGEETWRTVYRRMRAFDDGLPPLP